jgi:hypothetical protein
MTLAGKVYIEYLPVNSAGHIVAEFDTSGMKLECSLFQVRLLSFGYCLAIPSDVSLLLPRR